MYVDPHWVVSRSAESLALGSNFTFQTDLGPLDLLGWVEPLGGYDELVTQVEKFDIGAITLLVIGLDSLISVKRHLGRAKDRAALVQLEAIRSERRGQDSEHAD